MWSEKVESFIQILLFLLREMIENYVNYITYVRQYSPATIYNYTRSLKKLEQYLVTIKKSLNDPEEIKVVDMYNFIEDMSKN